MEGRQNLHDSASGYAPEIVASFRGTSFLIVGFEHLEYSRIAEILSSLGAIAGRAAGNLPTFESRHAVIASVPALIDVELDLQVIPLLLMVGTPEDIVANIVRYATPGVDFLATPWTPPELIARAFRLLLSSPRVQAKFQGKGDRPQILIADDDPDITNLLRITLGSHADCRVAGNGLVTLRSVRQSPPDVLLLDVNMPVLDGFHVLKTIRNDPGLRRLPVILLTASDDVADIHRGLDLGADDYIVKPFGVNALIQRVRSILNGAGYP